MYKRIITQYLYTFEELDKAIQESIVNSFFECIFNDWNTDELEWLIGQAFEDKGLERPADLAWTWDVSARQGSGACVYGRMSIEDWLTCADALLDDEFEISDETRKYIDFTWEHKPAREYSYNNWDDSDALDIESYIYDEYSNFNDVDIYDHPELVPDELAAEFKAIGERITRGMSKLSNLIYEWSDNNSDSVMSGRYFENDLFTESGNIISSIGERHLIEVHEMKRPA